MKNLIQTTFFLLFTISFAWGQNQNYTAGTNAYTFNTSGTFQLTGIPDGTVVQVECYGAGGGGGGVWTAHYASTSSGGAGGGGYAELNYFTVSGGTLKVIVGKGGLKGTGSTSLEEAYDGENGNYSAVYFLPTTDTICKANGGKGSPHVSAANGSVFSPAKALGPAGNGGHGTIGNVLTNGADGTQGATSNAFGGGAKGGDGGNGAGPLGGPGGLYANSQVANYGVDGSPYGGGGSGCADYEGSGGATYKIGGNGANGGVIITILDIKIMTQPLISTSFCAGDLLTVAYTATGIFNTGNTFSLQLSDATGDFTSPTVIGSINSTTSGSVNGTIPTSITTGTGYRVRVVGSNPAIAGSDNGSAITLQAKPASPAASTQDFCGAKTVADLSPNGANIGWYSSTSSTSPLLSSQALSTQDYFVSETINGCESDKTTVQINIHSLPTIDAGTDQTVCDGTSVTLSGSGAGTGTYAWNNSVTDGTPFTPTVGAITYTVTGTDGYGCQNTDEVEVTVNPSPIFTLVPTDPTGCTGADGTITLSGLTPSTTYDVTYAGNGPTFMTSNAAGDITITGLNSGTYTGFTVATATSCSTTDGSSITLSAPSAPNISATGGTICAGDNVTISASGTPTGGTYSWDNGAGTNATASVSPGSTTTYTVTYSLNGCDASASATVLANPLPTIDAGTDQTVCDGSTVTLTATNPDGALITWNNGVTDGNSFIPSVGTNNYTATAIKDGCSASDQVQITVNEKPNFTILGTNLTSCSVADGIITIDGLTASSNYTISFNGNSPVSMTSNANGVITISGLNAGTYSSITVENSTNCSSTNNSTIVLTQPSGPIANAGDTLPSICKNETSVIMNGSISGTATSSHWIGGSGTWNDASDPLHATYTAGLNDSGWIQLQLIASGGSCPNDTAFNYIKIDDCNLAVQTEVQNKLKLYPNPVHNAFNIEGENLATDYDHFSLTTMTGKIVKSGKINSNHQTINVLNLDKGFYLLQMKGKKYIVLKLEVQ